MARNPTIEQVKRLVRRQGIAPPPAVQPLVAEVRTHGVLPLTPCEPEISYALGCILIEWTFGIPYQDVPTFHQFLEDNEAFIRQNVEKVEGARYLGTYWSIGHRYHYRTFWAYDSESAIAGLNDAIRKSPNLSEAITKLRTYWSKDSSRSEFKYQPASLSTAKKLEDYAKENPVVGMGLVAPAQARKRPRSKK
ncbi:hypothetical protein LB542_05730 [Mesorhizobium sp. BR1-1-9]|uniref:hypothetical protein n=1 Tax=unclassified Mesorhizobium TaxID=325217 RepID=UPI00112B9215|nr:MULTISPECIES: hypothetical protein [unclassified Mesorhizobium]MBZ9870356.1 hypothetical protein [Mesorhizobium sp. BR1-1-9]MBZ9942316.1 hypothetical protein [Mesorhizobium sp. BR1-1-13]MBZ9982588.1 hypothetical protein [Mesorhizobium sp. BR-1-1-8]TPI72543.1 hypothetical protein FJ423_27130 [Mesorhizobium sp. B2-8-9]TPL26878.1 hypothetical protein FJ947_29455 [Mesorhizobium sp. B2-4-8]